MPCAKQTPAARSSLNRTTTTKVCAAVRGERPTTRRQPPAAVESVASLSLRTGVPRLRAPDRTPWVGPRPRPRTYAPVERTADVEAARAAAEAEMKAVLTEAAAVEEEEEELPPQLAEFPGVWPASPSVVAAAACGAELEEDDDLDEVSPAVAHSFVCGSAPLGLPALAAALGGSPSELAEQPGRYAAAHCEAWAARSAGGGFDFTATAVEDDEELSVCPLPSQLLIDDLYNGTVVDFAEAPVDLAELGLRRGCSPSLEERTAASATQRADLVSTQTAAAAPSAASSSASAASVVAPSAFLDHCTDAAAAVQTFFSDMRSVADLFDGLTVEERSDETSMRLVDMIAVRVGLLARAAAASAPALGSAVTASACQLPESEADAEAAEDRSVDYDISALRATHACGASSSMGASSAPTTAPRSAPCSSVASVPAASTVEQVQQQQQQPQQQQLEVAPQPLSEAGWCVAARLMEFGSPSFSQIEALLMSPSRGTQGAARMSQTHTQRTQWSPSLAATMTTSTTTLAWAATSPTAATAAAFAAGHLQQRCLFATPEQVAAAAFGGAVAAPPAALTAADAATAATSTCGEADLLRRVAALEAHIAAQSAAVTVPALAPSAAARALPPRSPSAIMQLSPVALRSLGACDGAEQLSKIDLSQLDAADEGEETGFLGWGLDGFFLSAGASVAPAVGSRATADADSFVADLAGSLSLSALEPSPRAQPPQPTRAATYAVLPAMAESSTAVEGSSGSVCGPVSDVFGHSGSESSHCGRAWEGDEAGCAVACHEEGSEAGDARAEFDARQKEEFVADALANALAREDSLSLSCSINPSALSAVVCE